MNKNNIGGPEPIYRKAITHDADLTTSEYGFHVLVSGQTTAVILKSTQ